MGRVLGSRHLQIGLWLLATVWVATLAYSSEPVPEQSKGDPNLRLAAQTAPPELQPPPAGKTFTETFIYGSWDGKFIFLEPMITKAYLESLKNTSGMHLNQGPITVFEGSNYAGDSRILDLQPNEERLLSYAIDLGTEVNPVPSSDNGRLTVVRAQKGIVYTTTKLRETKRAEK